jgi:hypothetical protein
MPQWAIFTRAGDSTLTGGLHLSSVKAVRRHLGVDTAVIETPYTPDAYQRTAPGDGIVVTRDGRQEFTGLIGSERTMGWDAASGQPTIKVSCVGDNVHLADRIVYPDPTRAGHDQTTADRWSFTGPASSAMWQLISDQLGPTARTERRHFALYMGTDPGTGEARTWTALFEPALTVCQQWSILSGANLGVRTVWTPDGLRADVYEPRDQADTIRFSADLTNLAGFTYTETAPSVHYALVAGQGDLSSRIRRSATSTNPLDLRWGRRIESYIDRRDESDPGALQQEADDAVTEGAGQANLTCVLTDSQAATYGRDWDVGDRVTVYVGMPGQTKAAVVVDVIREVSLDVTNDGAETITPAIGGADAKTDRRSLTEQQLADLRRNLEGFYARK